MTRFWGVWLLCLASLSGAAVAQGWEAQTSGTANMLKGVWFTDAQRGFAVGDAGTILRTVNGGQTWMPIVLTNDDMQDVAFVDASVGLIVGDNGLIFRTTNGGDAWGQVSSGTTNHLAGVAFGSGGLAYAAGRDGTIVRSVNNGASWSLVETGTARYRSVAAYGNRAWIVGNEGEMRATEDGGVIWFPIDAGTVSDLHDAWFVSEAEGWTVGQNNLVLYTDDGGATWVSRNSSIVVGLDAVFFGNPNLGWTVGGTGNAFRTTTGGLAWAGEPTPTLDELEGLHFADAFNGWAVGDNGTILVRHVRGVELSVDRESIGWQALTGVVVYDVVVGNLGALRETGGDFASATELCLADDLDATTREFTMAPDPGEGLWLLVRDVTEGVPGTYDSGSFLQTASRDAGISVSGAGCP